MKRALVFVNQVLAGVLIQKTSSEYEFAYDPDYKGPPISLTLPVKKEAYRFSSFPAFFDGLLPEGIQLEALLKQSKLNKNDHMGQLITVGEDLVGAVTVRPE